MAKQIIRGDSYETLRPLYQYELLDDASAPLDLTSCTIMVTFKPTVTTIEADANDTTAVITHEIQISGAGAVTFQDGLYVVGTVAGGTLEQRLTPAETIALPVNTELHGDLQLIDANGEVFTWIFEETLIAIDGLTHRAPN